MRDGREDLGAGVAGVFYGEGGVSREGVAGVAVGVFFLFRSVCSISMYIKKKLI